MIAPLVYKVVNNMKFQLYTCCDPLSKSAQLAVDIIQMEWQQIEVIFDLPMAMKFSKGKISPVDGWVIITKDGQQLFNVHQVSRYLNENGLILC